MNPALGALALALAMGPGLATSACAARSAPAAPAPSAAADATAPAAPPSPTGTTPQASAAQPLPPDCPRGAPEAPARMAEGQALIEASMVGEHPVGWDYLWGLQALREAADAGYPPALYAWGRQRFGNLYLDQGPDPDNTAERQAYVVAIAAIATAARLGSAEATAFFSPDILAGLLDPTGPFPDRTTTGPDEDLSMADIPTAWWEEARVIVDHHRRCWP